MTTYTAIADTDIDIDSGVTTSLMTRLRDNPLAILEGASGAPKLQTAGIADGAVTLAKLASDAQALPELDYVDFTTATSVADLDWSSYTVTDYSEILIIVKITDFDLAGDDLTMRLYHNGTLDTGNNYNHASRKVGSTSGTASSVNNTGTSAFVLCDDGGTTRYFVVSLSNLEAGVDTCARWHGVASLSSTTVFFGGGANDSIANICDGARLISPTDMNGEAWAYGRLGT